MAVMSPNRPEPVGAGGVARQELFLGPHGGVGTDDLVPERLDERPVPALVLVFQDAPAGQGRGAVGLFLAAQDDAAALQFEQAEQRPAGDRRRLLQGVDIVDADGVQPGQGEDAAELGGEPVLVAVHDRDPAAVAQ
ncbi:hypothetical protein U2F26_28940 [Micromonospora sp. 4G57]|uniref:Uncharacterized protein n=1 Tax=Micromonospora sicca TaxID=2202420 RepID=A0ABU5JL52_9ACTN|nr:MULTISPECIES: hypothetical protein [unclassified Micromonospora]MDZ5446704.1 hypothetical protein [Micromonospora sp. 4G57]MDZ5493360.1 hypothetical protein [Micromonospora sp. 4G53]